MWEESQTGSFHYQRRLQRGAMLSGSSFGYKSKQKGKCDVLRNAVFFLRHTYRNPPTTKTSEPAVELTQLKTNEKSH